MEADTGVALEAVVAMEAASVEVSAATSAALPAAVTPSVAAMEKELGGVMASAAVISGDSLLSATPSTMTHVGGARAIIDASAHNKKLACAPRGATEFVRPISRAELSLRFTIVMVFGLTQGYVREKRKELMEISTPHATSLDGNRVHEWGALPKNGRCSNE